MIRRAAVNFDRLALCQRLPNIRDEIHRINLAILLQKGKINNQTIRSKTWSSVAFSKRNHFRIDHSPIPSHTILSTNPESISVLY